MEDKQSIDSVEFKNNVYPYTFQYNIINKKYYVISRGFRRLSLVSLAQFFLSLALQYIFQAIHNKCMSLVYLRMFINSVGLIMP